MFKTDNNVPASKFILDYDVNINFYNIYQYCSDINPELYGCDYINFGTDGIIRDLFNYFRGLSIYYDLPNYKMIDVYANLFKMKLTNINQADVVYVTYPNGCTLNFPRYNIWELTNKIKIIDLSYYIYTSQCSDFTDFQHMVEKLKSKGFFVIYGPSKTLGLPGLRVGFCNTNNLEPFNTTQPWQITSHSKLVIDSLWNKPIIDKHTDIIKKSKQYFIDKFRSFLIFDTEGPFLALSKDFNTYDTRDFGHYKRFSVIDKDLLI